MVDQTTINLLLQIPLAGVVVVVVVLFLKHQERANQQMLTFMADQATNNREFLRIQREQNNDALGRLAEENKAVRVEMARLTDAINHVIDRALPKRNRNT